MPATRHTPEQKEQALAVCREVGLAEAARRTGINPNTMASWARRAHVQVHAQMQAEHLKRATLASQLTMAERRARLAADLLEDAERLRQQLWDRATVHHWGKDGEFHERELPLPTASTQRTILAAAALAIDKSQLLAGEATERLEQVSGERIVQLREALVLRVSGGSSSAA